MTAVTDIQSKIWIEIDTNTFIDLNQISQIVWDSEEMYFKFYEGRTDADNFVSSLVFESEEKAKEWILKILKGD